MTWTDGEHSVKISVCVPAYRAEAYIGATIESVLAQTFRNWELIVVDNNSPDRTGEIARSYDDPRIQVETNSETLPLADNWNAVAALAGGEYLKILCADDTLHPDCLAEQASILDRHRDVALVASRRDFLGPDGEVVLRGRGLDGLIGKVEAPLVVEEVVRSGINPIGWPAALLLRRRDFPDIGAFDTRWLYPIDLEMSLRILAKGSFFGIERSLASFRISPDSASSTLGNQGSHYRDMLRLVAKDPRWQVGQSSLRRGLVLSHVERVRKYLLFGAVNSKWPPLRRLPSLVLRPRPTSGAAAPDPAPVRVPSTGSGPRPARHRLGVEGAQVRRHQEGDTA